MSQRGVPKKTDCEADVGSGARFVPGGFFISFEGQEGAGKTTQLQLLAQALEQRGWPVLTTREPGGTSLGEELRRLVKHLHGDDTPCPESELLIMAASRVQLLRRVVEPALAAGKIVLCDRFLDSTTAYQGYGRRLNLEFIDRLHAFTVGRRMPDLTILLDLQVAVGAERSRRRGLGEHGEDRFENEQRQFHERVREGFLQLARQVPERIRTVDAGRSPQQVHEEVLRRVDEALA